MIAVSLKDGEELVDLLLRKDADVNAKSEFHVSHPSIHLTRKAKQQHSLINTQISPAK